MYSVGTDGEERRIPWLITNAGIPQAGIRSRSAKVSGPVKAHSKPVGSGADAGRVNPLLYALCVVLSSAISGPELAGCWPRSLCAFNKEAMTTTVEITADDSIGSVADKLQEAGLIKYKWFFRLLLRWQMPMKRSAWAPMSSIQRWTIGRCACMQSSSGNMNSNTVTVTIPEGYTVMQTIQLLAKNGVATEEALLEAAKTYDFSYDFIDNASEDLSRLEGYLFPDTYEFYTNMSKPENALDKLLSNFNSKLDDDLLAEAETRGYDLKDIVTIASLIEKETDGTDRERIASVIYNRLEGPGDKAGTYGMLQIDASLLYGLEDHEGTITNADLQTDTPYNLYKYAGLPPTPIANPGLASIEAALEPESTDYYYYALGTDGLHHFFTNYSDFTSFLNSDQYGG